MWKRSALLLGPVLAAALGATLKGNDCSAEICWTAAITIWCATWWIFEPIPIPATSLIPLALLPIVNVLKPAAVAESYGHPLILLMLGGFMLSTAMERSGAHRRIALNMVRLCGGSSGRRLVFGFMAASAGLSMWLSNAGTTLMLLPIASAVLEQTRDRRLKVSLLLGVAYAASVGGIGTPIGTPPNLFFLKVYRDLTGSEPAFLEWMCWTLPIVFVMVPLAGLWLTRGLKSTEGIHLPAVGSWRTEERRTLAVFVVTACFWTTRKQPWGGWSEWLNVPYANDASVALLAVVVMFVIPNGKGERLLDWKTAATIPWGVLILFGGGISIATAFVQSGLSQQLGENLVGLGRIPVWLLVGLICLTMTFLTEVTSNTATTTLLLPILATAAVSAGIEPRLILVPATVSASFAFMLPVATPPNAIVFSHDDITIRDMAREGLVLNLLGVVVVTAVCYWTFS